MGGADKGLVLLNGKPLVAHVLDKLSPQVDEILINANRTLADYAQFGHPVVQDSIPDFAGPLAGLHSGLSHARHPLAMMVPCDSPFLPDDMVTRLVQALEQTRADLAVVKTGGWRQPVFSLCRTHLLPHLTRYLEQGGRKVDDWYASLNTVEVAFDDIPDAFTNINTREELASLKQ